jgi:hypothetical protein
MKLTYRGIRYNSTPSPSPQMGKTIATGKFRGAQTIFRALAALPVQPSIHGTWRRVPYGSGIADPEAPIVLPAEVASAVTPVVVPEPAPTSIPDLARNLFIRRHQRSRRREQGMMVRLAAEVGMQVEDAAHYESHIQGKIPHDFSAYDRSSTAMS